MILESIWTGPEARLLPASKLHGPTVAVVAIMTFAMMVVAAAGLALANSAAMVASAAESRFVVQIPSGSSDSLAAAVAAARSVRSVRSVTPVPEREMRRTLERWLGEAASSSDLPVPQLVTVELAPAGDLSALARAVQARVPGATVAAVTAELEPVRRSIRMLQWLALALVLLMTVATGSAIVLAARGALDTHRPTVEIMHGIGATDRQLTRLFERKIAVDALAGALGGAIAAALVLMLISAGIATVAEDFASASPIGIGDAAILALLPVAAVVLAVGVAHWTLLRALRETL